MLLAVLVLCALGVTGAATEGEPQTLYETLGVDPGATPAQIRSAYRKLALALHPDKTRGESGWADSTARFIKVSEAYETLSNAKKREAYDAKLKANTAWFRRRGGSGAGAGAGGQGAAPEAESFSFQFSFSLADALSVLEKFIEGNDALQPLATPYRVLKASLHSWEGFTTPLPELLASGALAKAFQQVDWAALGATLGDAATRAIKSNFENDDGSIQWGKVAATGAIAATTLAAALDAADDGNRTSDLLKIGSNLLNWWTGGAGE
jgi:curved DNA-binding protein CbpA